jgi:hypothetical protein
MTTTLNEAATIFNRKIVYFQLFQKRRDACPPPLPSKAKAQPIKVYRKVPPYAAPGTIQGTGVTRDNLVAT